MKYIAFVLIMLVGLAAVFMPLKAVAMLMCVFIFTAWISVFVLLVWGVINKK